MMVHPDRLVFAANIGVTARAYAEDGAPLGPVVGNLRVLDDASGQLARYHDATGVHGFVRLRPGPRTLWLSDPLERWLPVAVPGSAEDRSALVEAYRAGQPDPGGVPGATALEVGVFPSANLPIPSGETTLWGSITVAGVPAPFAFVQIDIGSTVFRGATDRTGRYQIWLRGVPFTEGDPPLAAQLTAAPAMSPGLALSADHVSVVLNSPAFLTIFDPPGSIAVAVPVRRRTRADLNLP